MYKGIVRELNKQCNDLISNFYYSYERSCEHSYSICFAVINYNLISNGKILHINRSKLFV